MLAPQQHVLLGRQALPIPFLYRRSINAPVGQTAIHCPQLTQEVSARGISNALAIWVAKPRLFGPITATRWFCLQTATQRRHKMHFELSRTRCEQTLQYPGSNPQIPRNASGSTPYSCASACNSQVPLLVQERQSILWLDRINSNVILRYSRSFGVLVKTSIPSLTG